MRKNSYQKGFAHFFLILGLAVLGLTVFIGSGGLSRFSSPPEDNQVLGEEKNEAGKPTPSFSSFRR